MKSVKPMAAADWAWRGAAKAASHNAVLKGRVQVRFVITRDGALSDVEDSGSDLPDGGVIRCVMSSMYGLSFPPPEGGPVKVVFPLSFEPAPPN